MASQERLLILKMLQEGTISAEDALKLLEASATPPVSNVEASSDSRKSTSTVTQETPELSFETESKTRVQEPPETLNDLESDVIARTKSKIAAAREKVAAVADQLAAADEKVADAGKSGNPLDDLADAVKALPGMRSVFDALSGLDPTRMASEAKRHAREVKRQTRRVARSVTDGIDEVLRSDVNRLLGVSDPTLTDAYEASLFVTQGMTLRVRNPFGDIVVQPTDNEQLRVAASINIWETDSGTARGLLDSLNVAAEVVDDVLVIGCTGPERSRKVSVDIVILMPRTRVRMTLMSPTGKISAEGIRVTSLVAATNSGDISLGSTVAESITLETTSGDVSLQGVVGVISVKSSSGDVRLFKTNGGSVTLVTGSGDIYLDAVDTGVVDVSSASGDQYLTKADAQSLMMASVSGDIRCTLAGVSGLVKLDSATGWTDVSLHGPIAPTTLTIHSVSGDCKVNVLDTTGVNAKIISRSGGVTLPQSFTQQIPGHYDGIICGTPTTEISVVTVSGDVTINTPESMDTQ